MAGRLSAARGNSAGGSVAYDTIRTMSVEWFQENAWWIWLAAALVLAGVEILMLDLIFLMLAAGALGGMGASLLGAEPWLQAVVFAVVSLAMLGIARPSALKRLHGSGEDSRSYLETLAGRRLTAGEEITSSAGTVSVDGDTWTARTEDGAPEAPAGSEVTVLRVEGATLVVRAVPQIDWDSPTGTAAG